MAHDNFLAKLTKEQLVPEDVSFILETATQDLIERVLGKSRLAWKPGTFGQIKAVVNNNRQSINHGLGELQKRQGTKQAAGKFAALKNQASNLKGKLPGAKKNDPSQRSPLAADVGTSAIKDPNLLPDANELAYEAGFGTYNVIRTDADRVGDFGTKDDLLVADPVYKDALDAGMKAGRSGLDVIHKALENDLLVKSGISEAIIETGALDLLGEVTSEAGYEILSEALGALPIVGAALNLTRGSVRGVKSIWEVHKIATMMRARGTGPKADRLISRNDPDLALQATIKLCKRYAAMVGARSSADLIAGGVQTAGLFLDFGAASGPAVGATKAAFSLALTILSICLDVAEFRAGQKMLEQLFSKKEFDRLGLAGTLAIDDALEVYSEQRGKVLQKCPLLGCYLITEAESSTLLYMVTTGNYSYSDYKYLSHRDWKTRIGKFCGVKYEPRSWVHLVHRHKNGIEQLKYYANKCQERAKYQLWAEGGRYQGHYILNQAFYRAVARQKTRLVNRALDGHADKRRAMDKALANKCLCGESAAGIKTNPYCPLHGTIGTRPLR